MTALVHRLSARGPDDVAPLANAISAGRIDPAGIVAILGKTEGNGCVNDFTRAFAVNEMRRTLAQHLPTSDVSGISIVMSGGTEGALAPHWLVLERRDNASGTGPALAIGSVHTPDLAPEQLGRRAQVEMVAAGVRAAMADAGIGQSGRRAFRANQVPAAYGGACRRSGRTWRRDGDARRAEVDGLFARGFCARRRGGPRRSRHRGDRRRCHMP